MNEHFKLLGFNVRDIVSGFEGVAESVSFDLYGCVQMALRPATDRTKPGDFPDGRWFDVKRLRAISKTPVMEVPDFADPPGGIDKPAFSSLPPR